MAQKSFSLPDDVTAHAIIHKIHTSIEFASRIFSILPSSKYHPFKFKKFKSKSIFIIFNQFRPQPTHITGL